MEIMRQKNLLKLGILFFAAMLFTVSCEKDGAFNDPLMDGGLKGKSTIDNTVAGPAGDLVGEYSLIAGQTIYVGGVSVYNDGTNVYVQYCGSGDYMIAETHLFVGDLADLPRNKKGNPVPGAFPYAYEGEAMSCVTHAIPLDDIEGCDIVAHAIVVGPDGFCETAFGTGGEEVCKVSFAAKAYLEVDLAVDFDNQDGWGLSVSAGTLLPTVNCYYSDFLGYVEINLDGFTSGDYPLIDVYNGTNTLGNVNVELDGGNLVFTITSALEEGEVGSSFLYVGDPAGLLSAVPADGCIGHEAFTDNIQNSKLPAHVYTIALEEVKYCVGMAGDIVSVPGTTRWAYYMPEVLCSYPD